MDSQKLQHFPQTQATQNLPEKDNPSKYTTEYSNPNDPIHLTYKIIILLIMMGIFFFLKKKKV